MRAIPRRRRAGMSRSIDAFTAGCLATIEVALTADQFVRLGLPQRLLWPRNRCPRNPHSAARAGFYRRSRYGGLGAGCMAPPMLHALIVGGIAFVLPLFVTAIRWTEAPSWYHFSAVLLQIPAAWLGGLLLARQERVTVFTLTREQLSGPTDASKFTPWRNLNR
jgi:hypothetical protein